MTNLDLRSPVLAALPQTHLLARSHGARILFRVSALLTVLFFLGLALLAIHFRWLPVSRHQPLYSLHDDVYLVLKGQTYTRFYPYSLIWWRLIGTVAVIFLITWTLDIAPVKEVQTLLLRWLIRRPQHHARFIIWTARLARLHVRPDMARLVTINELENALLNLGAASALRSVPIETCRQVVDLAALYVALEQHYPASERRYLHNLSLWNRVAYLLHAYADDSAFSATMRDVMGLFEQIKPGCAPDRQAAVLPEESFSCGRLAGDMCDLLALDERRAYSTADLSGEIGHSSMRAFVVLNRLGESIEARRRLLHRAYNGLEHSLMRRNREGEQAIFLSVPAAVDLKTLHAASVAALGVVVHVSLLTDSPAVARAYIESLESLYLVLAATPLESPAVQTLAALFEFPADYFAPWFYRYPRAALELVERLLSEQFEGVNLQVLHTIRVRFERWVMRRARPGLYPYLPLCEAYRVTGLLMDRQLQQKVEQWKFEQHHPDPVIQPPDFAAEARTVVGAWLHASGPSDQDRNL